MFRIYFILVLILIVTRLQAQTFHPAVKVEFEKTVYVKQLYKTFDNSWFEMMKDRIPETAVTYHEFLGDTLRSVFSPGKEAEYDSRSIYRGFADKNVVYNDYRNATSISQKPVFEETFLVEDSLLKIKWKLTADTRMIAGYECRKAIGFIDDTVAVFAFYTDEILVRGGPESIHGLPGMILGLGMPRIHTTWFATRVEVNGINTSALKPSAKGKKIKRQDMIKSIQQVLKNWGTYGQNLAWNFLI